MKRESVVVAEPLAIGIRAEKVARQIWLGQTPDFHLLGPPAERAMMRGYEARWRNDGLKVEKISVPFRVSLGFVDLVGEIDAVGTKGGQRWLRDLKTTGDDISPGSPFWRRIVHVDPQVSHYLLAARELGWDAPFMEWDVIHKPKLRQGQKESEGEFELRVLKDIEKNPNKYYRRATIVRMEDEHAGYIRDLRGQVKLMQVGEHPKNPDACFKWGRACDFLDCCTGSVSINDPTRFRDSTYVKEKPGAIGRVE